MTFSQIKDYNKAFACRAGGRRVSPECMAHVARPCPVSQKQNEKEIVIMDDELYFLIEDGVLTRYTGLSGDVSIPKGVTKIGTDVSKGRTDLTGVAIPDTVAKIGVHAFDGCTGLTSVAIPGSVAEIGQWAFHGCTGLTSVTLQEGVSMIQAAAFWGCTSLTGMDIPESATWIGTKAFYGCTGLASMTIPKGVTTIDIGAFEDCTGLTDVTIQGSSTMIGMRAFTGCPNLAFHAPAKNYTRRYAEMIGLDPDRCTLFQRKEQDEMQSFSTKEIEWAAQAVDEEANRLRRATETAPAAERVPYLLRAEQLRTIAKKLATAAANGNRRIAIR